MRANLDLGYTNHDRARDRAIGYVPALPGIYNLIPIPVFLTGNTAFRAGQRVTHNPYHAKFSPSLHAQWTKDFERAKAEDAKLRASVVTSVG